MARPIKYDLDKVLNSAMDLFWQKGYSNVSTAELVKHTGLSLSSMYSLFGSKEGLFKDALDNYNLKIASNLMNALKSSPRKKGIEELFNYVKIKKNVNGCLFVNSMVELNLTSAEFFEMPKKFFDDLREQIEINLTEAAENGEFSGDIKAMTLILINLSQGYHIYGKYNQTEEESTMMIDYALGMIK